MTWLLGIVIGILPLYLIRFSIGPLPTTALEAGIWLVFAWWVLQKPDWRTVLARWRPLGIPLVLIAIGLLIGVFAAPEQRAALGYVKGFFIDPILLALVVSDVIKMPPQRKLLGWVFAGGALLVAVHALWAWAQGDLTPDGRLQGLFSQPNYLGMYLAPFAALMWWGSQGRVRWWNVLLTLTLAVVLFGTQSRGALLAAAAAVIAPVFIRLPQRWKPIGVLLSIVGIAALAAVIWWGIGERAATSDNLRREIWQVTLQMLRAHPLEGVGLAAYQDAFGLFTADRVNFAAYITPMALTPHNLYLMFWVQLGIIGLAGFVALAVVLARRLLAAPNGAWNQAMYGALVAILAYGLVDTPYFKNDLSALWWIVSAYALTASKR